MGNYRDEYMKYYEELKNKSKGRKDSNSNSNKKNEVNSIEMQDETEDIYPSYRQQSYSYYRGSGHGYNYRSPSHGGYNYRGQYNRQDVTPENYLNKYLRRTIYRLMGTALLFVGVLCLKSMPYKEASKAYITCKSIIDKNFDYDKLMISIKEATDEVQNVFKIDNKKTEDVEGFKEEGDSVNIDSLNNESKEEVEKVE